MTLTWLTRSNNANRQNLLVLSLDGGWHIGIEGALSKQWDADLYPFSTLHLSLHQPDDIRLSAEVFAQTTGILLRVTGMIVSFMIFSWYDENGGGERGSMENEMAPTYYHMD